MRGSGALTRKDYRMAKKLDKPEKPANDDKGKRSTDKLSLRGGDQKIP
jgi:hypothetical protein